MIPTMPGIITLFTDSPADVPVRNNIASTPSLNVALPDNSSILHFKFFVSFALLSLSNASSSFRRHLRSSP